MFFFYRVCYNVRQKHRNLHVFRHKVGQEHWFFSVFNALASKNLPKYRYLQRFFILVRSSIVGAYQNDPNFHFNTLLSSDPQKSSKNLTNTT